jgi:signal transduction histidine kinase
MRFQQLEEAGSALSRAQHLASIGTLAAGVAHELNNPLAAVIASVGMLRRRLEHGEIDRGACLNTVARIERSAWHASKIATSLLTYARGADLTLNRVAPNLLIQQALELARLPVGGAVELSVDVQPDAPTIICDRDQIIQVLVNVLRNASDALTSPGRIQLTAGRSPAGGLLVRVSDTGQGMAADVLARAFDPFFTTKPFGEGTGLGLSLSRGIVRAHFGEITIESQIGRGTQVSITLPVEPIQHPEPV